MLYPKFSEKFSKGLGTSFYRKILRPILFQLEPEVAHNLVFRLGSMASPIASLLPKPKIDPILQTEIAGCPLANPIGLAAGFDKNARLLHLYRLLGFGFAEIGSVSAQPWSGNPKPRIFRLVDDEAMINRLGLNSDGVEAIASRLQAANETIPLGVNITKTNDPALSKEAGLKDIQTCFEQIQYLPIKYVTLNVSCVNYHEGNLENAQELQSILTAITSANANHLPIFLKLSIDTPPPFLKEIIKLATEYGVRGYVASNTSTMRPNTLKTKSSTVASYGKGGLSGKPLKEPSLSFCRNIYALKTKEQQIIACGGISSGADAYEFIKAGANACQIYTSLIYQGPYLPRQICQELTALLRHDDLRLAEAIGTEAGEPEFA